MHRITERLHSKTDLIKRTEITNIVERLTTLATTSAILFLRCQLLHTIQSAASFEPLDLLFVHGMIQ